MTDAELTECVYVVATGLNGHAEAVRVTEDGRIVATGAVGEFEADHTPEQRQAIVRRRADAVAGMMGADVAGGIDADGTFEFRFDLGSEVDRSAAGIPDDPQSRFLPGVWRWVTGDRTAAEVDPHPDRDPTVTAVDEYFGDHE